jgi:hypothetical protein
MPLVLLLAMPVAAEPPATPSATVSVVLDQFHTAASVGDKKTYLELLTRDMVFLGTDGTERWQGQAWRDFVAEHFADGLGWTYLPVSREITLTADGRVAWFDELLDNEHLGRCRGSGLMLNTGSGWHIAQYNLSIPIPNSMAETVARDISAMPTAE